MTELAKHIESNSIINTLTEPRERGSEIAYVPCASLCGNHKLHLYRKSSFQLGTGFLYLNVLNIKDVEYPKDLTCILVTLASYYDIAQQALLFPCFTICEMIPKEAK